MVQDPDFDLSRHVRYVENKNGGPMSREDMLAFLSTVINTPPPLDRPPWEILVSGHHPSTAARRASVAALLLLTGSAAAGGVGVGVVADRAGLRWR